MLGTCGRYPSLSPGFEHKIPQIRLRPPREKLEQHDLVRPTRTDQCGLLAFLQDEVGVLEDEGAAPGPPDIATCEERRHVS